MRFTMRRPFKRKSPLERLLEKASDSVVEPMKKINLPDLPSDKTVKAGLIAAGGLTGLTAGSAGISSLRRRAEGAEGDS